jgi:hypothetical protein
MCVYAVVNHEQHPLPAANAIAGRRNEEAHRHIKELCFIARKRKNKLRLL